MKGISYCDECANYDWENERCNKGASIEDDYGRIYQDCPLPDAEPVRHGKWIKFHDEFSKCSLCNYPTYTSWNQTDYCPNCGAKLDGGAKE